MPKTISNPDGNDFDFADPEFWEYYGVESCTALDIAEGFTEYWLDVAGWYVPEAPYTIAERVAARRRESNILSLATISIPGTRFKTHEPHNSQKQTDRWTKSDVWMQFAAKHLPDQYRELEWAETDHPFLQLCKDTRGQDLPVNEDDWRELTSRLADQLEANSSHHSRRPPKGNKRRELLEDGLLHVDGARLARQDVLEDFHSYMDADIQWGPVSYPKDDAYSTNYFVIGVPQSGKTTLLRLFIQSVFSRTDLRLVVYDHKTDLIPVLTPRADTSTTKSFYILNPYDARSVGWDVAADVTENSAATFASILIPAGKEGDDHYFTRIPRNVLAETIKVLIKKARQTNKKWTLLHLMLAIRPNNLRSVLAETTQGCETYNAHIHGDSQTQQNVRSGLEDCSTRYLRVAAAWSRIAEKPLSLTQWARSASNRKGIILGNNDRFRTTLRPLNQAILHYLCGELVDETIPKHFRTFMILDEFERLGRIPGFTDTVMTSAGRKLNVVLGIHDFDSLRRQYDDDASAILGTCGFKAFLRVENPNVAEWLSKRIDNQGVRMPHSSTSLAESQGRLQGEDSTDAKQKDDNTRSSGTTTTTTTSQQYHVRRAVTPHAIMSLPLPSAGMGLNGYFQGPPYSFFYKGRMYSNILFDRSPSPSNPCTLWQKGPDEAFQERDEASFEPPDDLFEPLRELGFERDDKPHTAPLRKRAPSPPTVPPLTDPATPQNQAIVSPQDIDISDMPKRFRLNKE